MYPPNRPAPPRPAPPRPSSGPGQLLADDQTDVDLREFGDEFDPIPVPDPTVAKAHALDGNSKNMDYIKSKLPMSHVGIQDFYVQMSKHQWQAAKPSAAGHASPMHVMKGMLAIGARRDMGANPMQKDPARPLMPGGHATDWDKIPGLERVNAYSFRGEKRSPRLIQAAGGFKPPSTRTDEAYIKVIAGKFVQYMKSRYSQTVNESDAIQYIKGKGPAGRIFTEYQMWRAIMKGEELHIGRMVESEFMKGYISTSRDVLMAFDYSKQTSADQVDAAHYAVYAVHSEGGFLLPHISQHVHGTKAFEAEIAHPGAIPWTKVVAFRQYIRRDPGFKDMRTFQNSNYIFMRKEYMKSDPEGMQQVMWSLGKLPLG